VVQRLNQLHYLFLGMAAVTFREQRNGICRHGILFPSLGKNARVRGQELAMP
jgi:hypothetical protein